MNDCLHLRKNESYQEFSQISGFERLFFIESIAGITLLAILLLAGSAVAKTITVDDTPGADYFRIQDAVDNATAEDTMLVYSGTYYENVNVNKQLVLRGIDNGGGKPILNANGNDSAITMSAGNSVLEGFKVVNAYDYSYDYGYAGIYIGSNRNIIRNNTVSNNWNGIFLVSSSNNTLINNTISNNSQGIDLLYSSNNMVIKNNVSNNSYYGIALESLPDLTAHSTNNTIYNNFFNNINNLVIRDSAVNTWNITKTESPNIINGSYLGGNVWANPGGTGFSQTCTDSDRDGICDSNYNSIDFLPLAYKHGEAARTMNANGGAGDKTITVDIAPGADYRRIQDAIDNATAGDTILVYSGTYSGIVVNKPLILKGIDKGPRTWSDMPDIYYSHEGGKPIVFSGMESGTAAVTLTAGNSTLDGFEAKYSNDGIRVESYNNIIINNNASDNSRNFGSGIILNGSNNILRNNTAMHNNHGFMLYLSSNNNTLSGNTALYNRESSITFSWQYLENPRNNTIYNNSIYNNFFSYNKDNFIVIHDNDANPWNTSKTPGMNIIGGSYLGGNVWIRSKGSGFSQTCEDNDGDGICDSPYVLGNNNIDMLPLAYTPFILANKLVNIIFIISLLSTFVMAYRKRDKIKDEIAGTAPSAFTGAYRGAFYGLIVGGVVLDLTAPLFLEDLNDPGWLIMGLILGGIYGVSVGITAGIIGGVSKNPFIGAISGFIGGMVEILAFGAIRAIEGNNLPLGAIVGGIFGGAFFAIVGSVIGRAFYGANNDAIVGAIVGGIIGGFGGVVFSEVMVGGLAGAVFFGAICGSFIGGFFSKLISANKYTSIIGIIVIGVGAIVIFIKMIRGDVISENVMVVDGIIGAIVSEATTLAPADSGLVVEGIAGAIVGAIAGWIIGSKEESINGNRSLKKYGS